MKKFLAIIVSALLLVGACLGLTACGEETLVVYTESGFAPFEYVDNGKIVGVDVDIMQKVADKLGKKLQFEDVPFKTIIDAVNQGKLTNVGAAGLSITEERKKKVDFSIPYYTANLYAIYKTEDKAVFESMTMDNVIGVYWDNFAGKNVGVQEGTTSDLFLGDELIQHFKEDGSLDWNGVLFGKGTTVTKSATYNTLIEDIGLNIDVMMMDEIPAQTLIKNKSGYSCAPIYYKGDPTAEEADAQNDAVACDEYAIAVTKNQTELLKAINEVLTELINDKDASGNNGIQQLVMKHLGIN